MTKYVSICCSATLERGGEKTSSTGYYVCYKCKRACDRKPSKPKTMSKEK